MDSTQALAQRIDAALAALENERKRIQEAEMREYAERKKRLAKLATVFEDLVGVIRPRLEVLIQKFGNKVIATPKLTESTQEITLYFHSDLARIDLRFQGTTDQDIRQVILNYELKIVPALMRFDAHSTLEMPLDALDLAAAVRWTDDRILSFVQTYIDMHQNQNYLHDQMVVDPVTGATFPKFAAAAKLEHHGRTHYFVSEESLRAFERKSAAVTGNA